MVCKIDKDEIGLLRAKDLTRFLLTNKLREGEEENVKNVKVFIMDVDGTMTDGKIYMGASGELFKVFDIKDGYGIHEILPKSGVATAIVTAKESVIVANRAKQLEINYVYQNISDKLAVLKDISDKCKCDASEFAYIGDDMLDLEAMKACGVSGCPANAVDDVKKQATHVCKSEGGAGAVREFIEWLDTNKYFAQN